MISFSNCDKIPQDALDELIDALKNVDYENIFKQSDERDKYISPDTTKTDTNIHIYSYQYYDDKNQKVWDANAIANIQFDKHRNDEAATIEINLCLDGNNTHEQADTAAYEELIYSLDFIND